MRVHYAFLFGLVLVVLVGGMVLVHGTGIDGGEAPPRPGLSLDLEPEAPSPRPILGLEDAELPVLQPVADQVPDHVEPAPQPGPMQPMNAGTPSKSDPASVVNPYGPLQRYVPYSVPDPAKIAMEAPPPCGCCPRLWVQGEYLMWWIRDSQTPPLVTTGTGSSLGVLGRPGTAVLFGGDIRPEIRSGARFTVGGLLDDQKNLGVELSGFFLLNRSNNFAAGSYGDPILSCPFFNAAAGREDAEQVANPALAGLTPLTGRVTAALSSRLWGIEPTLVKQCTPGYGICLDLLAGLRYLQLNEGLVVTESLRVPGSADEFPGTQFRLRDSFGTENDFYAGQVGGRLRWQGGPLALEFLGKVALGDMHQMANVNGATRILAPGAAPASYPGALLAQRTNMGDFDRERFAVVPEAGVKVGLRMTQQLRATLGYSFLYVSSVARPGDQIDRAVNPSQRAGNPDGPRPTRLQPPGHRFLGPGHLLRVGICLLMVVERIGEKGHRRSARPGRAPVCLPLSSTTWPLTITYSIPSLYWNGSV